ncbi:MAG: ATP-binding protein [Syntrophales bacterium]
MAENLKNPTEKNLQTIKFLQESELSKHPVVGSLLSRAIATGDFNELDHYMSVNRTRFEAFSRLATIETHRQQKNPFYPFPNGDDLLSLQGPIKIGIINKYKGHNIFLSVQPTTLTMHTMVIGRSGSGKTVFMMNVLPELSKNQSYNLIIIDVKGTYRRMVGITPNLYTIPFHIFKFNPLEVPSWMSPIDFMFLFPKIFTRENLLSIPSENLISTAIERLFHEKGIFRGGKNYPTVNDLNKTIDKMEKDKSLGYRYRDIFESVRNRLAPYNLLKNTFSDIRGIPMETFVNYNVILELPLIKIPDFVHNFIVSWISNAIYYRNMTLGLRGNQLRTLVIIDEARTIVSSNRESGGLEFIEPGLNEIITKGREFGIGLWLISQETASFSQVYRSNSILKVAFQLHDGEDVSQIKKSFGLSDEQVVFYYKLPAQRMAICRYGKFERPFLLGVPEVTGLDHVPDDRELDAAMADFYAKILPAEEPASVPLSNDAIDGLIMIKHLINAPFLNYKDLITALHLTPARGDQARAWIVNSGLVNVHSIVLRRGKPGKYFELTEEAYRQFGGRPPAGKGGFEHKLFCHAIQVYAEQEGFNSRLEGIMDGTAKPIDVLAWKKGHGIDGYEVTLHMSNLLHNVTQDLRTTLKKVIVVCRNKDEAAKAQKIVRDSQMPMDRLEFKTIFNFSQKL